MQYEFFLLWSKLTIKLHAVISKLEKQYVSEETMNLFWIAVFGSLYLSYDTSREFFYIDRMLRERRFGPARKSGHSKARINFLLLTFPAKNCLA